MLKNTILKNWEDSHIGKVRAMIATWNNDSIVAAFNRHREAGEAVKEPQTVGFDRKKRSSISRGEGLHEQSTHKGKENGHGLWVTRLLLCWF